MAYPIMFEEPRMLSNTSAWVEHIPFAMTLVQMTRPRLLVELGTHKGDSYLAFCQAVVRLGLAGTRCHAIDTWRGDPHAGQYGDDVLTGLRAAHDGAYGAFSTLIQSSFDSAAANFSAGEIDLLHIDGLHTYEAVRHDFETWLPKLSEAAVVLFHDTAERSRGFAVWKLWEELTGQYPAFEFKHGHGLGVLVVGKNPPAEVLAFMEFARERPEETRSMFDRLGERLLLRRTVHQMLDPVHQLRQAVEKWQRVAGAAAVDPPVDMRVAMQDPAAYALAGAREAYAVIDEDVRLRQAYAALEARARSSGEGEAEAEGDHSAMISVVVCSKDEAAFERARDMYQRVLADWPHEVLGVIGAGSMCAGHNQALGHVKGEIVVFSHDDVEVLCADLGRRLAKHLKRFDVVGLAGTDKLVSAMWSSAGPPHLYGQVAHANADGTFGVQVFSVPSRVVGGIQALDGLFIAARRDVAKTLGWDEGNFRGWHCYDADFTFRAHLSGYQLGVAGDIPAIHYSRGKMNEEWRHDANVFAEKFAGRLSPAQLMPRFQLCEVIVQTRENVVAVMSPAHWGRVVAGGS